MYIETLNLDFSQRKEYIEQHHSSLDININEENFEVSKIIHNKETDELILRGVNWLNPKPYKDEYYVKEFLTTNLDILIYDYLIKN